MYLASRYNKLPEFVSRIWYPVALALDAVIIPWSQFRLIYVCSAATTVLPARQKFSCTNMAQKNLVQRPTPSRQSLASSQQARSAVTRPCILPYLNVPDLNMAFEIGVFKKKRGGGVFQVCDFYLS